jgi:hypothetical protein
MIREFGNAVRDPGAPAVKSKEPMEQAWPTQTVLTGLWIYCIC